MARMPAISAITMTTAFGDLTEETGVDGIEEYDGEQYAEWCHERPSCSILAALRFSALFAIEEPTYHLRSHNVSEPLSARKVSRPI